jgi:hypothetical protein
MTGPETRIVRLELRHAAQAVERAWLVAKGASVETDLERLLQAVWATLDMIKEPVDDCR